MAEAPTIGDLVRNSTVMSEDVHATVIAYLADRASGPIPLGKAHAIDVAEALAAHPPSAERLARAEAAGKTGAVHDAVRTAVLLSRPVKA